MFLLDESITYTSGWPFLSRGYFGPPAGQRLGQADVGRRQQLPGQLPTGPWRTVGAGLATDPPIHGENRRQSIEPRPYRRCPSFKPRDPLNNGTWESVAVASGGKKAMAVKRGGHSRNPQREGWHRRGSTRFGVGSENDRCRLKVH